MGNLSMAGGATLVDRSLLSPSLLSLMLCYLCFDPLTWLLPVVSFSVGLSVIQDLGEEIECFSRTRVIAPHGRQRFARSNGTAKSNCWRFCISFLSPLAELLHPISFLQWLCRRLIPSDSDRTVIPRLSIAWSYCEPISRFFLNPAALRSYSIGDIVGRLLVGACGCRSMDKKFCSASASWRAVNGQSSGPHVLSVDPSILNCPELEALAKRGLNYIPVPKIDLQAWKEQLFLTGQDLLSRLQALAPHNDNVRCNNWQLTNLLEEWIQLKLSSSPSTLSALVDRRVDTPSSTSLAVLHSLQERLYMCEVDKAPHQLCCVCKDFAILTTHLRLSSPDFSCLDNMDEALLIQQLLTSQSILIPSRFLTRMVISSQLLSMRFSFKAHKQSFRFITNGSNYALSPTDRAVQLMSAELLRTLEVWAGKQKARLLLFPGVVTQLFPVIRDYSECILNLPAAPVVSDFTADIARCFEAIPTEHGRSDGLLHALQSLATLIFNDLGSNFCFRLVFSRTDGLPLSCSISKRGLDTAATLHLSQSQFLQMSSLILQGAITAAGGRLLLQRAGIPMGLRSSPDWCNLYLLHQEVTAIQRICRFDAPPDQIIKLSAFNFFFRSMDDLRVINGQPLVDLILFRGNKSDFSTDWIYPDCLGIDTTSQVREDGSSSTCFLDILTEHSPLSMVSYTTFAKESKLPFQPIQYADPSSNRPTAACYNVAVGATLHAIIHASSPQLAVDRLNYIIHIMARRGYVVRRVRSVILRALDHLIVPGIPYSISEVCTLAKSRLRSS